MTVYIIRPKTTSVARSLKLASRKFTPESRPSQVAEVVNFWKEDYGYQEIISYLVQPLEYFISFAFRWCCVHSILKDQYILIISLDLYLSPAIGKMPPAPVRDTRLHRQNP